MSNIPVICDRCGATGIAGQTDFTYLGDLLEFTPVPRQLKRKDGWTPVLQREFIARLTLTASPQLAVDAMGKNLHGLKKLLKAAGSDSFAAAWERALALGEGAEARRRISEQAEIQGRNARRGRPGGSSRPDEPEPDDEEDTTALRIELIERLVAKFQRKVGAEREARLAGEIVAADFYLRQITALEVAFDLMIEGHADRGWTMLMEARRGERNMLEIADTRMARILDQARRDHWAAMAEPNRPLLWPERYLIGDASQVDIRTEPIECSGKASRPPAGVDPDEWQMMDLAEQQRIWDAQHKRDAEAQVEWEASAHEAWVASEHGAAARRAAKPRDGDGFSPSPQPLFEEDYADRAMREALAAARRAHPEDFEEDDE